MELSLLQFGDLGLGFYLKRAQKADDKYRGSDGRDAHGAEHDMLEKSAGTPLDPSKLPEEKALAEKVSMGGELAPTEEALREAQAEEKKDAKKDEEKKS